MTPLFKDNPVVNWHEHVWTDSNGSMDTTRHEGLLKAAEVFHFDKVMVSRPISGGSPTPQECRDANDTVHEAVTLYPDLLRGMAFVNPGFRKESCAEIERCIKELGFVGIKLYNQYYISDPVLRDTIEKCIELDIPILEHAGKLNHNPWVQPFISDGTHFAKAAQAYPEATFIYAHVPGGGDWHWALRAIAPYENIYADMSGSICDEGIIEAMVEYLGAERILFGTDGSYTTGFAKMMAADISEQDKLTILDNKKFHKFLNRRAQA